MAREIENTKKDKEPATNGATPPDAVLPLKGRFAHYNSTFLQLMIPLLTTRYLWLAIEDLNPLNFLKKPDPSTKINPENPKGPRIADPGFVHWKDRKPGFGGYLLRNFAALGMGATILGLTMFYSKRTYNDIRALYAEAVGYEFDKKPQDVTMGDLLKSENAALEVTRHTFIKRTLLRTAAASTFFLPWHIFRDWRNEKPKYDANLNAGIGSMGIYLSLDGFIRKQTFFEAEQSLVGRAINHSDTNAHVVIEPEDIQLMMMLQKRHLDKNYQWPLLNSHEGLRIKTIAHRIADLLNQTYNNTPKTEKVRFTIGKFNYLLGFGMLDKFPESLGFIDLANRSSDMKEVKTAAEAIKHGQDPKVVFRKCGIDLEEMIEDISPSNAPGKKYAEQLQHAKDRIPQASRTFKDFASSQGKESTMNVLQ